MTEASGGAEDAAPPAPEEASELELKFVVPPEHVAALRAASWVRPLQQGRTSTRALNAIYFDTPDRRIWNEGFSLRVRKEGRRFIQTMKTRAVLGDKAFTRGEWQTPIRQAEPDPAAMLAFSDLAELLPEAVFDSLEAVCETHIRRTTRRLQTPDGSVVEWALDIGEIVAGTNATPVAELELELVDGPVDGLFRIARDLVGHVPLRLTNRSKANRGYALAAGEGAPWRKAADVELDASATAEDALAHTVSHCLEHLVANEDCVLARCHIEGVHQMRVALRRLRSALAIYRRLLPAADLALLEGHAKRCIGLFGPARDWDVFVTEIAAPVVGWITGEPALIELRDHAERMRDRAYEEAQALIRSPEYTAMLLDFGAWLNGRGWREQAVSEISARLFEPAADLGRATLKKRHHKLLKVGQHLKTMTVPERHRLRIAVKKQRYATEFFATLFPKKAATAYVQRLTALQDHLGLLNDIATAARLTTDLAAAAEPARAAPLSYAGGLIVGWRQSELCTHEDALLRDWKRLKTTKPFW